MGHEVKKIAPKVVLISGYAIANSAKRRKITPSDGSYWRVIFTFVTRKYLPFSSWEITRSKAVGTGMLAMKLFVTDVVLEISRWPELAAPK